MSLKSLIPRLVTSQKLLQLQRKLASGRRRLSGARPVVHYFHQVDDPHAALAARALVHLETRYGVEVRPCLVSPPADAAAPDRVRLRSWGLDDAALLARGLGLDPTFTTLPAPDQVAAAEAALAGCTTATAFQQTMAAIEASWRGEPGAVLPPSTGDAAAARARGDALRQRLGHYLGGTFHFEGEWTWGLDRLPCLEQRLASLNPAASPFVPRLEVTGARCRVRPGTRIEAFVSLRSPYTYIAVPRLTALAEATGAELVLRPVLPMVMRGLPVPLAKRLYIIRDTAREARRLGLPFGAIADPVGRPAERGLAVLCAAIGEGSGPAFLLSFLQGVFAEGVDAGTDAGLSALCARAGVSQATLQAALADDSWRAITDANRADMLAAGIWGVPSFRVVTGDTPATPGTTGTPGPTVWGQDRLWAVEQALLNAAD